MPAPVIRPLTMEEAHRVYQQFMKADFPPDELKPWQAIKSRLNAGAYLCLGLFEEDHLRAYAFFACFSSSEGKNQYLFDYFAVPAESRGRGWGSCFLQNMRNHLPNAASIIGEAENPSCAPDERERMIREKRMRFYLKNGVKDTGVEACIYGVEYRILHFGGRDPWTPDSVRAMLSAFYHSFFPPLLYKRKVKIR